MSMLLTGAGKGKDVSGAFNPVTAITWTMGVWADDPSWSSPGDGNALVNTVGIRDFMSDANSMTVVNGTPLFRQTVAAFNNKAAIEFDGVNESIQNGTYNPPDQPISIVLIYVSDTSAALRTVVDAKTAGSRNGIELTTTDTVQLLNAGGTVNSTLAAADGTAHLVTAYLSGASSFATVDGTASGTLAVGSTGNASGWTIGTAYNGAQDFPGKVAWFSTFAGDVTADAQWSNFKSWVNSNYGITVA